jgi:hypothetical protein
MSISAGFPLRKGAVVALEADGSARKGGSKFLWRTDGRGTVTRLAEASGD